jgi:hypothetical protein
MENEGLLFIPDISGFTRFVTETEIDHSRRVIQELLEVVIDANQLDMQVSEVEGDAVLFYRFGRCPDLGRLSRQVERMFRDFHERLAWYEISRFCQCKACSAAGRLTLKVITHYGEFTSYSVRSFDKLIGKDVIVAHQLLKNDVADHEYWLVTARLPDGDTADELPGWIRWQSGVKRTDSAEVPYRYASLSELRRQVVAKPMADLEIARRTKMFTLSREYDDHIIKLFHATGDVRNWSRWQEGVKEIEADDPHLPRVGMRCRCVLDHGEEVMVASSYSFSPDRIEFSQTDERKNASIYFTLEALGPQRTRVTVDFYVRSGWLRELAFRLVEGRRFREALSRSLDKLERLLPELEVSPDY